MAYDTERRRNESNHPVAIGLFIAAILAELLVIARLLGV